MSWTEWFLPKTRRRWSQDEIEQYNAYVEANELLWDALIYLHRGDSIDHFWISEDDILFQAKKDVADAMRAIEEGKS